MGQVCSEFQPNSSKDPAMKGEASSNRGKSASSQPAAIALRHGPGVMAWRRAHEKMKGDESLWVRLLFTGIQHDGVGGLQEHRRCPCCGSTLSRRTTALHAVGIMANLSEIHSRSLDAIVDAGEAAQRVES